MPKMKTRRAAAKRFSLTASGKIKIKRSKMRHILTKKDRGMKRRLRKIAYVHASNERQAKRCIPYGA